VGQVRSIRFHHLRHTTASLLLMSGADLAAVQRIMRHQDPRTTTEFYGHLAGNYLKKEIERLSFGPAPAEAPTSPPHAAEEPRLSLVAGGAPEPPLPADTRADARSAAPFVTRLLPNLEKGRAPSTRRVAVGKDPRGLNSVGARGFEPPTFCSQIYEGGVPGSVNQSQPSEIITESDSTRVQPSQPVARKTKNFATRLLPKSGAAWPQARVQPSELHPGWENNPGTAVPGPTTPTPNDLGVLYSGRNRLLTVREVAEQLGVCAATVYRLCERGELPHVRIVQSIRIRPGDLQGFLAAIEPGQ
jgi:excisionase family DNA binding protein